MTRITSGLLKAKFLKVPDGIRPLMEKVRKAIFDSLGELTQDAKVLDLFAGSGAAGIEAVSHGAASVTFVDNSPLSILTISDNTKDLNDTTIKVIREDAAKFVTETQDSFDLIIADPPYADMAQFDFQDIYKLLAPSGIFILSHSSKDPSPALSHLSLLRSKKYGDTAITYYQKPA
jgi:16S rRNA (guanine966-N2)-methyltransferase